MDEKTKMLIKKEFDEETYNKNVIKLTQQLEQINSIIHSFETEIIKNLNTKLKHVTNNVDAFLNERNGGDLYGLDLIGIINGFNISDKQFKVNDIYNIYDLLDAYNNDIFENIFENDINEINTNDFVSRLLCHIVACKVYIYLKNKKT